MTMGHSFKLRLVTWSVVGLAVLQLVFGRYDYYPFIHWTMFAFKERPNPRLVVSRVVVLGVDSRQETHVLNLTKLFGAVPGSGGPAKSVAKRYLNRLRRGDVQAASDLARLARDLLGIEGVVIIRVETWTWDIDVDALEFGGAPTDLESRKPDRVEEIISLTVPPN
ncbi:MAG: hypothetical protein HW375_1134 [Anaerolineales bacterium]|nr:hypothetical protein [Anaerolineales bacterium]